MAMIHHAIAAAQRGWRIFPVEPMGKTPHRLHPERPPEDAPWCLKWGDEASNDFNKIVWWWTKWPTANIGVAAKPSRLLIVDCDKPKGSGSPLKGTPYASLLDRLDGYADGWDVYREMCLRSGGDWNVTRDTYTVATGSGGIHFYYQWPDGLQASQTSLLKGLLDIRCNGGARGGYVLGAGSITDKGPYTVEDELPVRDCPPWLIERCRERPPAPKVQYRSPGGIVQPGKAGGNFDGLINAVMYAGGGNINTTLYWSAWKMAEDGATEEQAIELLAPAYVMAGGRGGDAQARQTIRSLFTRQQRG